ncbi:ABC transporter ATP-binding protein [Erythrobacter sanguineus]|uniref:Iron(III) transport system ATP-binding protein n=1 Tax=Erythrobacter sanguineus TaxID=198312 RepID=A0A1M7RZH6_9SPHN|nr:ABC transporter ATP-binding protein [Erythrobacter sanguineus]SHN51729.1 iron(III) transport system ATP-binding protein [Erythrobacter sanguineus]
MSLEFRHIAHAYGQVRALEDISFTAPTGEITCLLGASGCGKSTLLGLAAGLLRVQQGSILIDGEVLADERRSPPPEARPVGLVFQDGALFPHMTIAANIAFGLPKGRRGEVTDWLAQVGLAGLGARYPHQLSGGQQQRAALARAMAPGPQVLLMDEPFASVDIVLRRKLRRDCRILLRTRGATTVLVTHDPAEALDIADRIAVMEAGRIVQFATPQELHDAPASAAVGAMFGGAQIVSGTRNEGGFSTAFGAWPVDCALGDVPDAVALDLLVHADALDLAEDPDGLRVRDCHVQGKGVRVVLVAADGTEITAETAEPVSIDRRYRVMPHAGSLRVFART